jgi:hypothetical protein
MRALSVASLVVCICISTGVLPRLAYFIRESPELPLGEELRDEACPRLSYATAPYRSCVLSEFSLGIGGIPARAFLKSYEGWRVGSVSFDPSGIRDDLWGVFLSWPPELPREWWRL